jgi:hypothetical protein
MTRKILQIAIPFVWFGAVLAISFVEAPLKFQAPGITIPLGLGIGRLVFFALNKIEILLGTVFLVSIFGKTSIGRTGLIVFAAIALILLIETAWLLPWLDGRAEQVINGTAAPFSRLHFVYIACDAVKLILLMWLGISVARRHLAAA